MRFFIVPLTTYLLSVAGSAVAINVDAALHCLSVEVYGCKFIPFLMLLCSKDAETLCI